MPIDSLLEPQVDIQGTALFGTSIFQPDRLLLGLAWLGLASGLFRWPASPGQRTAGVRCCGKGAFTASRLSTFSFRFCEKLRGDTTVVFSQNILRLMSCFVFLTERSLCWQRFQLPQCFDCFCSYYQQ